MLHKRQVTNKWYHSTVQELFAETCQDRPEKTAIVYEDQHISYKELKENVNRLSQSLLNLGVKPGDHVAMLPTSCPEFTYVYFAALQIGALINPLNLLWGQIELNGILHRNDPKVIFTIDQNAGRDYIELLKLSIPDLTINSGDISSDSIPRLTHMVSLSRTNTKHDGFLDFNELISNGKGYDSQVINQLIQNAKCTDVQFMCQTSGSTGLSKSALWNHRPPLATVNSITRGLFYTEDDSYINIAPYYHNSGLAAMNMALALTGTTLYLMENFHPVTAVEIMQKYEPNTTFGFDAHFQAINKVLTAGPYKCSVTKAASCVTPNTYEMIVKEWHKDTEVIFSNLYAQTESGPLITFIEPDCVIHEMRKTGNGRPISGVELVIKEIGTDNRLPDGSHGEICYKSPFMFSGYYKQEEEAQKQYDDEGYFHSGDYGYMEGGLLYFLGRLGDVVKSGGENVSTTYVSSLLLQIFPDDFEDVVTVGLPDPYWSTRIVSCIRMKEGKKFQTSDRLRKECKGKMAAYEIPKDFIEWDGLWPMSGIGKLDFKALIKKVADIVGEK